MSGISTVAMKDGHEGIRHGHHHPGDVAAQERLAKLGAYGTSSSASVSVPDNDGEGYFERVAEWRDHEEEVDTDDLVNPPPEEQPGLSGGELEGESSGGSSGISEDTLDTLDDVETPPTTTPAAAKPSLTQKIAEKLDPRAKLPMPPKRSASSYYAHAPNPPCTTPATPLAQARNPMSQFPSTLPGPNNNKLKSSSSSSTSASGAGNGLTPYSTTAPSPASTVTTNSVREAKHRAKMLGPMTYDEGFVDTTSQNGSEAFKRSPSPPIVLNESRGLEGERMELEERVEGSRKERLDEIEERIVGGEHGAFRD